MKKIDPTRDPLYLLTKAVEQGDPQVAKKVKDRLYKSDNPSEMRYLEGLLILLGEKPGELEDPPDLEDDPDEYWHENDYFEV
tara:strand:+ start:300 stop:545 length:246 start_codon:yes stop_codon:yes gene_type:complete